MTACYSPRTLARYTHPTTSTTYTLSIDSDSVSCVYVACVERCLLCPFGENPSLHSLLGPFQHVRLPNAGGEGNWCLEKTRTPRTRTCCAYTVVLLYTAKISSSSSKTVAMVSIRRAMDWKKTCKLTDTRAYA